MIYLHISSTKRISLNWIILLFLILSNSFDMNPHPRGKKFRSAHVHSILRKRLAKEELLNREYPTMWSDFSMEVIDKTILMSDFKGPTNVKRRN